MLQLTIAQKLIALKDADLELRDRLMAKRVLSAGYHPEMEALHAENAAALGKIIDEIGYPSAAKVGEAANRAAWLVVQHAIGHPELMCRYLELLEKEAPDSVYVAYLSDRIAVFRGIAQRYGTQFDWDDNGLLSPNVVDDPVLVDQRRKALGLNSLADQTRLMRRRIQEDNESPPPDIKAWRNRERAWRIKVGWIRG